MQIVDVLRVGWEAEDVEGFPGAVLRDPGFFPGEHLGGGGERETP